MGFRIHRGIFQKLSADRSRYENSFKVDDDGRLKPVDDSGNVTGAYLTSVPSEFLTQNEGDGRYVRILTPSPPASASTSIVGETIEVSFTASPTSGIDQYQVWGAQGNSSYNLIAQLSDDDLSSTMTVVDTTFSQGGTRNYRIYAIKSGVQSSARVTSRSFTSPSLEPLNMSVIPMEEAFHVTWDAPASRFVDHYEVYHHSHESDASLSRSSATLVYSGLNTFFTKAVDDDDYHQFWVEVITA